MHGNVTDEEWTIFKEAYQFFAAHCDPPANQDEQAGDWWQETCNAVCAADRRRQGCPLMRHLLFGIFDYLEDKAKAKTEIWRKEKDVQKQ